MSVNVAASSPPGPSAAVRHFGDGALETLLTHLPMAVSVLDRDLRFRLVNEKAAAINGRPAADHVGRPLDEVLPGLPGLADTLRGVMARGVPLTDLAVAGSTAAAPGRPRRWLASYYPVGVQAGTVDGVVAVFEEVDDPAERVPLAALVEDHARALATVQAVVASAPVGIGVLDPDLRYRHLNAALAAIDGSPTDTGTGRTVREVVPSLAEALLPLLGQVRESGRAVRDEVLSAVPSRADRTGHWLCSVFPVPGAAAAGTPVDLAVTLVEVTGERRREDRVRRLRLLAGALAGPATVPEAAEVLWREGRLAAGAEALG